MDVNGEKWERDLSRSEAGRKMRQLSKLLGQEDSKHRICQTLNTKQDSPQSYRFTKSGPLRMDTHKLASGKEKRMFKHPSYYKKLKAQARAEKLNAKNSERFVKGARPQADKPASAQASSGSRTNKR